MNALHQISRPQDRPKSTGKCRRLGLFVVLWLSSLLLLEAGCRRPSSGSAGVGSRDPETERVQRRELLDYAVSTLLDYEQHESPEMLEQAVSRLDQWVQDQKPLPDWKPDPIVTTLPEPFPEVVQWMDLGKLAFPKSDLFALEEAIWLRDVSNWARGDALDELDQARQLFDWTVRNVQLEWDPAAQGAAAPARVLQMPWETLLLGRGTATDRAWVFLLLARQQRIHAALLGLVDPDNPATRQVRPWVIGVLSQKQIYLFDPTLGLPIPAPGGLRRAPAGQLEIRPATLAEVAADGALLRQLDVDPDYRYGVTSPQVQNVVALLDASPAYLSQRMRLLESQLAGQERLVLTVDASAQAERFNACPNVVDSWAWPLPYRTVVQQMQLGPSRSQWQQDQLRPFSMAFDTGLAVRRQSGDSDEGWGWWTAEARSRSSRSQPPAQGTGQDDPPKPPVRSAALWKGRLAHFKHKLTGEKSAMYYYARARSANTDLQADQIDPQTRQILTRAKMYASSWLGLAAAEQGKRDVAIDWLATRTLEAVQTLIDATLPPLEQRYAVDAAGLTVPERMEALRQPMMARLQEPAETSDQRSQCQRDLQALSLVMLASDWIPSAKYNLARVYEADGQIAKAVQVYRSDADSPYRYGNLLRARWLESLASAEGTEEAATPAAGEPESTPQDASQPKPEAPAGDAAKADPGSSDPSRPAPATPPERGI